MKILYLSRNIKCGYSLDVVTSIIKKEISNKSPVSEYQVPCHRAYPWHMLFNIISILKFRKEKAVLHQTGDNHYLLLGLIRCKTVLTIHDLVPLERAGNKFKWLYKYLFYYYFPIKIANRVVCISEKTKTDLQRYINTDRVVVIHNPINPLFRTEIKDFNEQNPVILHIGTGWNKNLRNVIIALRDIKCHLRIIGKLSDEHLALLSECRICFSVVSDLTAEEIVNEYVNCDIVSFPSIYEGFGMPVIEGQKTGRVVITSAIEPLTEIAGEGAEFVNPNDVNSIRNAFMTLIQNNDYRNNLIKKGLDNVRRFDVKTIADKYWEVYKSLENE